MTLQEVFNINIKQGAGVVDCTTNECIWHFNEYGLDISSEICVKIATKIATDFAKWLEALDDGEEWLFNKFLKEYNHD